MNEATDMSFDDPDEQMAWFKRTGQIDAYWRKQDPATFSPLTFVDDAGRTIGKERPPKWFVGQVRATRCESLPQINARPAARPRERRDGRSRSKRGSPSSDDDPSEPAPQPAGDAERFAVALLAQVKAIQGVVGSFVRDLGTVTPAAGEALDRELEAIRESLATFIEAERVERAASS